MKKINKETKQLNNLIVEALQDLKAEEIITLDLRAVDDTVTDFYIICHGNSNTQVAALSDTVYRNVKAASGELPKAQEGKESANWVILDYFDTVVHIFHKEARAYYQLEELWNDAEMIEHK